MGGRLMKGLDKCQMALAFIVGLFMVVGAGGESRSQTPTAIPPAARLVGYEVNTFSTQKKFSPTTVDVAASCARGFQWYFPEFLGAKAHPEFARINGDGTITLAGVLGSSNGAFASATFLKRAPYFTGIAFGGGGYFEAEIAFDPSKVDHSNGWPSWWMLPLEHLDHLPSTYWPGQDAGFEHFAELDIFEYFGKPDDPLTFASTLHDWYGVLEKTCPGHVFCGEQTPYRTLMRRAPASTNWNTFHKLGILWVPATEAQAGRFAFYLDGVLVGDPTFYSKFKGQAPPPGPLAPWTFGVADQQHFVLLLGTGTSSPLTVRSVNVWQKSNSMNLIY